MFSRLLSRAAALLALSLLLVPAAFASYGVYPMDEEGESLSNYSYEVPAGGMVKGSVMVRNEGEEAITLAITAVDAGENFEENFTLVSSDNEQSTVGTWVTTNPETVSLAPGAAETVEFKLRVPDEVLPGSYAGGIVVQERTENELSASGFTVQSQIGTRVYVEVVEAVPAMMLSGDWMAELLMPANVVRIMLMLVALNFLLLLYVAYNQRVCFVCETNRQVVATKAPAAPKKRTPKKAAKPRKKKS